MLPFVIGGGILIALAFLFDDYSLDPANFGKNTPLAAYLKTVGEQAFGMMLPVLSGFIEMCIRDRLYSEQIIMFRWRHFLLFPVRCFSLPGPLR